MKKRREFIIRLNRGISSSVYASSALIKLGLYDPIWPFKNEICLNLSRLLDSTIGCLWFCLLMICKQCTINHYSFKCNSVNNLDSFNNKFCDYFSLLVQNYTKKNDPLPIMYGTLSNIYDKSLRKHVLEVCPMDTPLTRAFRAAHNYWTLEK